MNDSLEDEVQRKFSVLEDFARTQPQASNFVAMLKEVVQASLASHKTSRLKRVGRELDTLAEECFVTDATRQYRERYWEQSASSKGSLLVGEVKTALREGRIRDADQMRVILIYLDQIATGLRKKVLNDKEAEELEVLAREFETRNSR
jgi:hypothetical protein